ncbi:hypothetical protein ABHA11_08960 [Enterococcus faecium]|uniref:hypothetical protein n=1 Tax=Enterococcus faecium TaxID=1352 RepID=UPI0018AA68DA|nr:hypothetical protein [Enterococcus faecium]MDB7358710.1 hypothetical protein [Enterococcus faecium]MDB7376958.1 hypothetical protein [Enterococcus faecium]MDB7379105.1 hypothetical protein [Enterococcus faecium]MDB7384110.1 hypothetical protein [Enterococcus faecium]MDB7387258.1 hypothetical protein [Enterococcus faecium]
MKIVYKSIEPYGFEQIILNNQERTPENCTEIKPPVPSWKPKFDFEKNQWSELATEEEKKGTAVDDIEDVDQLKQLNALLTKQLTASIQEQEKMRKILAQLTMEVANLKNGGTGNE